MTHDKLNGGFVDVVVFPAVGKLGQTAERLIYGGHFKGWKVKYIIMPGCEFIRCRPQGGL